MALVRLLQLALVRSQDKIIRSLWDLYDAYRSVSPTIANETHSFFAANLPAVFRATAVIIDEIDGRPQASDHDGIVEKELSVSVQRGLLLLFSAGLGSFWHSRNRTLARTEVNVL